MRGVVQHNMYYWRLKKMNAKRLAVVTRPLLSKLLTGASWECLNLACDVFAQDSLLFAKRFRVGPFCGFASFQEFCSWFAGAYAGAYVRLGCPRQAWSADWVCRLVSDFIREEVQL